MNPSTLRVLAALFHTALPARSEPGYLERCLLSILADVHRRTNAPVRAVSVSTAVGKDDRWCRRQLASMEARGLVQRVGERKGWLPSTTTMLRPTLEF